MANDRDYDMKDLSINGFILNAFYGRGYDDGDIGSSFPFSDAEDFSKGARFVPGEVTTARRGGQKVRFVTECSPNCWYWEFPDAVRIYHYDPMTYHAIGKANGRKLVENDIGTLYFEGGPGSCPSCGNVNTSGGAIKS